MIRYDKKDIYEEIDSRWSEENSKEVLDKLSHFWIFATHRTVTTQYTGSFISELFWIQDELNDNKLGNGVNRIIYRRD